MSNDNTMYHRIKLSSGVVIDVPTSVSPSLLKYIINGQHNPSETEMERFKKIVNERVRKV